MPAKWDIPPGRHFMRDLRAQYLSFLSFAGKNVAEKHAAEATIWMREHAPWKDVTVTRKGQRGPITYEAGHARRHLVAEVLDPLKGTTVGMEYEAALARAATEDRKKLSQLNRDLKKKQTQQDAGLKDRYKGVQSTIRRSGSSSALSTLPKSMRTERPQRPGDPIFQIIFRHGDSDDVPYAIWLEIANGGKYSIILPTIDYWGPKLMRGIQAMLNLGIIKERPGQIAARYSNEDVMEPIARSRFKRKYGGPTR